MRLLLSGILLGLGGAIYLFFFVEEDRWLIATISGLLTSGAVLCAAPSFTEDKLLGKTFAGLLILAALAILGVIGTKLFLVPALRV